MALRGCGLPSVVVIGSASTDFARIALLPGRAFLSCRLSRGNGYCRAVYFLAASLSSCSVFNCSDNAGRAGPVDCDRLLL